MSEKTVAEKARVKPGSTVAVLNAAPGVVERLGLPDDTVFTDDTTSAQLVFLFVGSRHELDSLMPPAARSMAEGSALWVFFRKSSKSAGLDMNRDDIWTLAEKLGMRPLGLVGVDETWSAFRLRHGGQPSADTTEGGAPCPSSSR